MVDLGSLVLLMSIFGVKIALAYVILGPVVAVIGGTVIEKLHREDQVEDFIRRASGSVDIEAPAAGNLYRNMHPWHHHRWIWL